VVAYVGHNGPSSVLVADQCAMDVVQSRPRAAVIIILALYLVQMCMYAFFVPAWESPDEPSHYLYAVHLARYGRPPGPSTVPRVGRFYEGGYITSMYEWYHPALGYLWPALGWSSINLLAPNCLPQSLPSVSPGFPASPGFPRLFVSQRTAPMMLGSTDWGTVGLRLWCGLLGIPLVLCVFLGARLLYPTSVSFAIASAGIVGLIPQFIFISATVRNDTANNLAAALCLLSMLWIMGQPACLSWQKACVLGVFLGSAVLTKATAAFLIPVTVQSIWSSPWRLSGRVRVLCLVGCACFLSVGAYILAFPEARVAFHYSVTHAQVKPVHLSIPYLLSIPSPLRDTFWATFGWANVTVPPMWIRLANGVGLIGILTTVVYCVVRRVRAKAATLQMKQIALLLVAIGCNILLVVRYNLYEYQPQGRFLFPSLLPLALLALWGPWHIMPSSLRAPAAAFLIGCMLLFSTLALYLYVIPAYY